MEAEIHTQEISLDSFDENGQLRMSFLFAHKDAVYVDDETGDIYDYSAWCQIVRVRAYDAAGHVTTCNALLYDTVYGQKMYEESGFKDARYSGGTIRGDILELDPLWNQEDAKLTDTRFFITDDMLDENGSLHVQATLARDANLVIYNGVRYLPQEGSRQVKFDIPIRQGVNLTYVKTLSSAFAENDFGTVYKLYLYYLPDTEPSSLRFDDERIADGAVVYTNEDAFTVSGDITSLYGNVGLKINGNQLLYPAGDLNVLAEPITQVFSYGAQLQEGEKVTLMLQQKAGVDEDNTYATMVTKQGLIKRTPLSQFRNIRKGGLNAIALNEDDALVWCHLTGGEDELIVATHDGAAIHFSEAGARSMGRTGHGVRVIKLRDGDYVVGVGVCRPGATVLTVTEDGKGRRSLIDDYRITKRGGLGIRNYTRGGVAGIKIVDDTDDLILISQDGILIRMHANDINVQSRYGSGVRVMRLIGEDKVAVLARVDRDATAETAKPEDDGETDPTPEELEAIAAAEAAEEAAEDAAPDTEGEDEE